MQKRLLILPIAWLLFGFGQVQLLSYVLRGIVDIAPTAANDKPIAGSVLPVLFLNTTLLLLVLAVSFYSLGYWKIDLSNRRTKLDLAFLTVLLISGFSLWYTSYALFAGVVALTYFLAVNVD